VHWGLWVDKGIAEVIGIALKIGKVSDDYATGDSQMTPNILSHRPHTLVLNERILRDRFSCLPSCFRLTTGIKAKFMMTHFFRRLTQMSEIPYAALIGLDWADQKHDVCL
jgi:hypothetical protein